MHLKSFVRRNLAEGALVFAGAAILLVQFAVQKHFLAEGGIDHTHVIGAPLDDVYIHCRYAENLLAGHGYSFNPGHILSADSSPLWVALIALGGLFTSHLDLVAMMLSAIAWLLLAPTVYRIARNVFVFEQSLSIAAGVCMLLQPRILAMALSGMETTFAALLVLVTIDMHIRSKEIGQIRIAEGLLLGLGIALRPELYLLAVLAILDWLYVLWKKKIPLHRLIGLSVPLFISAFIIISIPWSESTTPHLMYHSSLVQGAGFRFIPDFYYIGRSLYVIFEGFWWMVPVAIISLRALRIPKVNPDHILLPLFLFLLPVVQGFISPQYRHFGRYVFPVIPLAVLEVVSLLRWLLTSGKGNKIFRTMKDRRRAVYLVTGIVILSLPLAIKWTHVYAGSVRNINDQHLAAASWINAHLASGDLIAADDVGAIGYFTKKNVADLTGLVSADFFPLQKDQSLVWKQARDQGANIFIIYTRLNPAFYMYAKDSLELLQEFRIREPLVSSADTVLSVFKLKK